MANNEIRDTKRRRKAGAQTKVPRPPKKLQTITLRYRHSLNTIEYGPGTVTVPTGVARTLLEGERNAQAEQARTFDHEPPDMLITGNRRGVYVPHGQLDYYMQTAFPGVQTR